MAMKLRQLRYFLSVVECGSITAAAQSIRVAQPALTRQIQELETDLGTQLFTRTARGVTLTDAGLQLQRDAVRLLSDFEQARQNAIRAGRGELGTLSLALPVMQIIPAQISELLRSLRDALPDVSMTFSHLLSEAQLPLLRKGRLDAGLTLFRPPNDPELAGIPIYSAGLGIGYPSDWRWPEGQPKRLKDLIGRDFVWLPRHVAPLWHDWVIHAFHEAGFVPQPATLAANSSMMLSLVAAGMGCAIMPMDVHVPPNVSLTRLEDLTLTQDWELVWRTDNPSSVLHHVITVVRTAYEIKLGNVT